jgi:hypothetical protein
MKTLAVLSLAAAVAYCAESARFPADNILELNFPNVNDQLRFIIFNVNQTARIGYTLHWTLEGSDAEWKGQLSIASVVGNDGLLEQSFFHAGTPVPDMDELKEDEYQFSWQWNILPTTTQDGTTMPSISKDVTTGNATITYDRGSRSKAQPAFATNLTMVETEKLSDGKLQPELMTCVYHADERGSVCSPTALEVVRDNDNGGNGNGDGGNVKGDNENDNAGSKNMASPQATTLALLVVLGMALLM